MKIQVDIGSEEDGPSTEFYDVENYTSLSDFVEQYMKTIQGYDVVDYSYSNMHPEGTDVMWIGNGDGIVWQFDEITEIKFQPFVMTPHDD